MKAPPNDALLVLHSDPLFILTLSSILISERLLDILPAVTAASSGTSALTVRTHLPSGASMTIVRELGSTATTLPSFPRTAPFARAFPTKSLSPTRDAACNGFSPGSAGGGVMTLVLADGKVEVVATLAEKAELGPQQPSHALFR